jgi:hypothetical protein
MSVVDLLSNRTPFHVFVTYLTFSVETGYARIMIWNWGIAEVMRHPVFGIGLAEWERPLWKSGSMDNFWLVRSRALWRADVPHARGCICAHHASPWESCIR